MISGAKKVLNAVRCISQNDHKIVFEAFKPACISLEGGDRVVRRMLRTVGGERHPQGLRLCSNEPNPLVTWSVTQLYSIHSSCLQPVTEDKKTGKMNLFIEAGLVASSCGVTVSGRGHREAAGEKRSRCVLSEVRENASSSILKMCTFPLGLNVRIGPNFSSGLRKLNKAGQTPPWPPCSIMQAPSQERQATDKPLPHVCHCSASRGRQFREDGGALIFPTMGYFLHNRGSKQEGYLESHGPLS